MVEVRAALRVCVQVKLRVPERCGEPVGVPETLDEQVGVGVGHGVLVGVREAELETVGLGESVNVGEPLLVTVRRENDRVGDRVSDGPVSVREEWEKPLGLRLGGERVADTVPVPVTE